MNENRYDIVHSTYVHKDTLNLLLQGIENQSELQCEGSNCRGDSIPTTALSKADLDDITRLGQTLEDIKKRLHKKRSTDTSKNPRSSKHEVYDDTFDFSGEESGDSEYSDDEDLTGSLISIFGTNYNTCNILYCH